MRVHLPADCRAADLAASSRLPQLCRIKGRPPSRWPRTLHSCLPHQLRQFSHSQFTCVCVLVLRYFANFVTNLVGYRELESIYELRLESAISTKGNNLKPVAHPWQKTEIKQCYFSFFRRPHILKQNWNKTLKLFQPFSFDLIIFVERSFSFYRAMHFSAKRGIAIACRPSVCLSVCL